MTSRNPASANPHPNNYLSPEILAKVNAHADRTMDRLFADLDEILSGDLSAPSNPPSADSSAAAAPPPVYPQSPNQIPQTILPPNISTDRQQHNNYPAYYQQQQYRSANDRQQYSPPPPTDIEPPAPAEEPKSRSRKSKPTDKKQPLPLWMKIFLGIGVGAVGLSSVLFWAIDRHKLSLPQNADLSFLPFGSKSSISQDDAKFAEYMRKSIAKIERANSTAPAPATAPATAVPAPVATTDEPGTIASTNPTSTFPNVTLLKILPNGDKPGAQFEIQGKFEIFRVGEKIGGSNWTLVTVAKGEAIVKKTSGEIRSIFVGQKF